jgi:hypothetical protein
MLLLLLLSLLPMLPPRGRPMLLLLLLLLVSHLGATTITLCPRAAIARGSAPITSPRPPVFDHGATSAEQNTMSSGTLHVGGGRRAADEQARCAAIHMMVGNKNNLLH